jgi:hypothetical protein
MDPLDIGWRRSPKGRRTAVSHFESDERGGSGAGDLEARREAIEPLAGRAQADADEGRTSVLAGDLLVHSAQTSSKMLTPKACASAE